MPMHNALKIEASQFHIDLGFASRIEQALKRSEASLSYDGALLVQTGKYTGRSPKDRFIVEEAQSKHKVGWGKFNKPISEENFQQIYQNLRKFLRGKELFVLHCFCGADPNNRQKVRFYTQRAASAHFVSNMFINPQESELAGFSPDIQVVHAPEYKEQDFAKLGLHSETFILMHLSRKIVLIGGTEYLGELKKSIFSFMNFLLPEQGVMPMHCSANINEKQESTLFFGLSGTGKTTLSADTRFGLIGDDEHGWSDTGVFNFEGGCYAKCINLSEEKEPEIFSAIRFGSILENVVYEKKHRKPDYTDTSLTENTRVSYPIRYIRNFVESGCGSIPKKIVFLTCDAFGVLPPVAKLNLQETYFHFLSGYTSKVAGTERGVSEPEATFSTCFGAPFMIRPPEEYANLLKQKITKHGCSVYLVNTGWTGGAYGVGSRIALSSTRAIINAIHGGGIESAKTYQDEIFGFQVPLSIPGVEDSLQKPEQTWGDKEAFVAKKLELASMFIDNFSENYPHLEAKGGPKID